MVPIVLHIDCGGVEVREEEDPGYRCILALCFCSLGRREPVDLVFEGIPAKLSKGGGPVG